MRTTASIRARDSGLAGLVVAGVVAITLAAHAHPLAVNAPLHSSVGVPLAPKIRHSSQQSDNRRSHTFHFATHLHVPTWLLAALGQLLLAAGILLLVLLVVTVVPRIRRSTRRSKPPSAEVFAAPDPKLDAQVSSTVDRALAGLRRGDREQAIIVCWLRLQEIVESAGYPPTASETSSELVMRWLRVLPLSRPPLTELAELYREARFSSHRMSAQALERATSALRQLRADVAGLRPGTGTDG